MDGRLQPLERPALTARDEGFRHGEAVYEGVRLIERRPLFLERHVERLARSAGALGLDPPTLAEARAALGELVRRGAPANGVARLYRTRGAPDGGPSTLVWIEPLPARSAPGTPPWRLVCHPERVVPYLPGVKHTSRLVHARARRAARAAGADDALLVHSGGWVLEGTASNVGFFEADTLHTPEEGCGILPGITREVVLEIAPQCGFRVVEGRYPPDLLAAADEAFLTFTSAGVAAVGSIDGTELPAPLPGPRVARLVQAYERAVARALDATEPL